jgi:hypothetical protein
MTSKMDLQDAKLKYRAQKYQARSRKLGFTLTFEEWCKLWNDSGHWNDRGVGSGKYVMSRKGDIGPYSLDNVFIQSFEQNVTDGNHKVPKRPQHTYIIDGKSYTSIEDCSKDLNIPIGTLAGWITGRYDFTKSRKYKIRDLKII